MAKSKMSRRRRKELANARKNRLEIIKARLTRRDMMKMGLLTSAGLLVPKRGLSAWATGMTPDDPTSPPTREFIEALPIMPVIRPLPNGANDLSPAPTIAPNTAGGEGRTRAHQAFGTYPSLFPFPPPVVLETHQQAFFASVSPDLPDQLLWGFARREGNQIMAPTSPGHTYHARYHSNALNQQVLVRNYNDLPPVGQNGGFGLPEVTTHLHNGHTPSESDGFPCDYYVSGKFYDQHYPNILAGFASTHPPNGDVNESLSTLWYHDHRVEFTAQNVYKGLAGFYLLFNDFDTGDETTGFRLPGVFSSDFYSQRLYDIPLILADRVFDEDTGLLFFDLFNLDGIIGDKFLVNGKIQPYLEVKPRRYRFRVLNGGPSRFYQLFLTNKGNQTSIPFWHISNDGNLLPRPIQVTSALIAVAERMDIIVDFTPFAGQTLYFENRLVQDDGRGPDDELHPPGQGNFILQFRVDTQAVADDSADPATQTFYDLPDKTAAPRVTRTFRFDRTNGQWAINNKLMPADCADVRFRVKQNTVEHWVLRNNSGGWSHPIHIHFEEFQILQRNGVAPGTNSVERARKDVARLDPNSEVKTFFRFRDFEGRYPMHCHNTIHEDHAMMLRWDIDQTGDTKQEP